MNYTSKEKDIIQRIARFNINHAKERLHELEEMKLNSDNKLMLEFLTRCTLFTKIGVHKYQELLRTVVEYLQYSLAQYSDYNNEFSEKSKNFEEIKKDLLESINEEEDINFIEEYALKFFNYKARIEDYFIAKNTLIVIKYSTLLEVFEDFANYLFNKVYKLNHDKLHIESFKEQGLNALKKIDVFSLLDDLESLPKLVPINRIKYQLSESNKVIKYLEEYYDNIELWIVASSHLINRLRIEMDSPVNK